MAILVDSNILLRSVQTHHPHYAMVEHAFAVLRAANETLNVMTQNFIEFWAVATRPAGRENGLGMTCEAVIKEVAVIKVLFPLLPEPAAVFDEWERLVTTYQVSGKNVHDARLVATMNLHGIKANPDVQCGRLRPLRAYRGHSSAIPVAAAKLAGAASGAPEPGY